MTYPVIPNLYEITVSERGNDTFSVLQVAAPDARKALGTVAASNHDGGTYVVERFEMKHQGISPVSLGENVLVWTPEDGEVRNMHGDLPG